MHTIGWVAAAVITQGAWCGCRHAIQHAPSVTTCCPPPINHTSGQGCSLCRVRADQHGVCMRLMVAGKGVMLCEFTAGCWPATPHTLSQPSPPPSANTRIYGCCLQCAGRVAVQGGYKGGENVGVVCAADTLMWVDLHLVSAATPHRY